MPKMEKLQNKTNFCFQQAEDPAVHLLYIYDDVTAYGDWNWNTRKVRRLQNISVTSWQQSQQIIRLNYI